MVYLLKMVMFHVYLWKMAPYANHGAGICTPTFAQLKWPSHVGKYFLYMEHLGWKIRSNQ